MNSSTLIVLICLFTSSFYLAHAQRRDHAFTGGILVGVNTSQIDGDRVQGYYRGGLALGGFMNYRFSKAVSLQSEMVYMELGSRSKPGGKSGRRRDRNATPVDVTIPSVSLPFLIKVRLQEYGNVIRYAEVYVGPSLGVQLYARDLSEDQSSPEISSLNRYDGRLLVGGELDLGGVAAINARFAYSFRPVLDTEVLVQGVGLRTDETLDVKWYHNYFLLSLRFNILGER